MGIEAPSPGNALESAPVKAAVKAALAGELPRPRSLKYWENKNLDVEHVQMIFEKAVGWSIQEIADKHEYSGARVSLILGHPDAQHILAVIYGELATDIADPVERFKATAAEAADEIVNVMRTSKNEGLRRKAALDILAMAGYGATKKVEVTSTINMPAQAAERLSSTLAQLAATSEGPEYVDYTDYTIEPPISASAAVQGEASGTGDTSSARQGSPVNSQKRDVQPPHGGSPSLPLIETSRVA